MAYADKITSMRRMAIIRDKSNIVWEGVNIEGTCVLKRVYDGVLLIKKIDELVTWVEDENNNADNYTTPLVIVYQDPVPKEAWEPRVKRYKK